MHVVHIDADRSGSTTIRHLVERGHVRTFSCPTFPDCEAVMWKLYRREIQADLVVLDTVTALAGTARQDIVMDPTKGRALPIWENKERLVAQKQDYYKTADVVNRLLRPLRELAIPSIFVCHERTTRGMESRNDPMSGTDKYIPNLQREINDNMFSFADAIVRLCPNPFPFQYGEYTIPIGMRMLIMAPTGDSAAGIRVRSDRPPAPPFLLVPDNEIYSFSNFVAAVGGDIPHNTVLYGPPKVGKTRWIGSAAYYEIPR